MTVFTPALHGPVCRRLRSLGHTGLDQFSEVQCFFKKLCFSDHIWLSERFSSLLGDTQPVTLNKNLNPIFYIRGGSSDYPLLKKGGFGKFIDSIDQDFEL